MNKLMKLEAKIEARRSGFNEKWQKNTRYENTDKAYWEGKIQELDWVLYELRKTRGGEVKP